MIKNVIKRGMKMFEVNTPPPCVSIFVLHSQWCGDEWAVVTIFKITLQESHVGSLFFLVYDY